MPSSSVSDEYELDAEPLIGWSKSDRPTDELHDRFSPLQGVKRPLAKLLSGAVYLTLVVLTFPFRWRLRPRSRIFCLLHILLGALLALICLTGLFWPSYTRLPPHYETLRTQVQSSSAHGRGNVHNQKVYIAAVLYDPQGQLASGRWGDALLQLIEMLGEQNVYLSIYENNSGETGENALRHLADNVTCNNTIISEPGLSLRDIPHVTIPTGEKRVRRIDYLAEVRNRALQPLDTAQVTYDKLLYLNDVIFDPVEVLQLLFCTNADSNGVAQYRAVCAVDFSNPFKFYDSYATRDYEGYGVGMPFFPWFTSAGAGESRRDVLAEKDAVRVRSCWGGMVAFDAAYFQGPAAIRFRADSEMFWDASECCIVHADVQSAKPVTDQLQRSGSYMNPFVRVAYSARSHSWLWTTRRFEKLYPLAHDLLNRLAGFPHFNPRRTEVFGEKITDSMWIAGDMGDAVPGRVQTVERMAGNDGFCGRRGLEVLVENRRPDQDGFDSIPIPDGLD
ncbi:hypothetical protein N7539_005432 [Penicillium diatomitis]|uniref:Uncharacterized protein n=1 Tax=Penicillium diatomitis TaxID=2819901 RepID=A0A9X0BUR1_9EURO|nr:uncharacterized protein N7539_005432 [Penicillium diatomitis]KAJ5485444.1 hypothetical protein N7539_005432 [Penicillium diatomitis]